MAEDTEAKPEDYFSSGLVTVVFVYAILIVNLMHALVITMMLFHPPKMEVFTTMGAVSLITSLMSIIILFVLVFKKAHRAVVITTLVWSIILAAVFGGAMHVLDKHGELNKSEVDAMKFATVAATAISFIILLGVGIKIK